MNKSVSFLGIGRSLGGSPTIRTYQHSEGESHSNFGDVPFQQIDSAAFSFESRPEQIEFTGDSDFLATERWLLVLRSASVLSFLYCSADFIRFVLGAAIRAEVLTFESCEIPDKVSENNLSYKILRIKNCNARGLALQGLDVASLCVTSPYSMNCIEPLLAECYQCFIYQEHHPLDPRVLEAISKRRVLGGLFVYDVECSIGEFSKLIGCPARKVVLGGVVSNADRQALSMVKPWTVCQSLDLSRMQFENSASIRDAIRGQISLSELQLPRMEFNSNLLDTLSTLTNLETLWIHQVSSFRVTTTKQLDMVKTLVIDERQRRHIDILRANFPKGEFTII